MRVVADTNVVVSGLMWLGNPRKVLDPHAQIASSCSRPPLCSLSWKTYQAGRNSVRLSFAGVTARDLVLGYAALASVIEPADIKPVILSDPDDDDVIACAVAASCPVIVSGDSHLLNLRRYQDIRIINAAQLIAEIQ